MSPTIANGREIIFAATDLRQALTGLCRLAEGELPGAAVGFTLADATGRHVREGVYPSLHSSFEDGLANVPLSEPYVGACTRAMGIGVAVVSDDILGDMRFIPAWRDLCLRAGLKALRSVPIRDPENSSMLGTFVVGYREPGSPSSCNDGLMLEIAALGAQAIALHRTLESGPQNAAAD
jgi:hypothetical protein